MIVLVLLLGLVVTLWLKVPQVRRVPDMLRQLFGGGDSSQGISSFQALAMALGGRIGVGNIAGVAVAIHFGGPGALFWMWVTAILGSAIVVMESSLAQVYKEEVGGEYRGGPAFYIEKGLGWRWLGMLFAVSAVFAFAITGPSIQANSIALAVDTAFGVDTRITGVVVAALFLGVVFGGMKRIGKVCAFVVPFMAAAYVLLGVVMVVMNIDAVPAMFSLIINSAIGTDAAYGGMLGAVIMWGVRRAVYSSEAGSGTGAQASAAAEVSHPVKQGLAQGFSVYIDTLFVCTITGLMILSAGTYNVAGPDGAMIVEYLPGAEAGPAYTQSAIDTVFPTMGPAFIAIALFFFAFTTLLSFGFYADTNIAFMLRDNGREKVVVRIVQVLIAISIVLGSWRSSEFAWNLADVGVGLFTWVNLIGLVFLTPQAVRIFKDYERQRRAGKDPVFDPTTVGITNAPLWEQINRRREERAQLDATEPR